MDAAAVTSAVSFKNLRRESLLKLMGQSFEIKVKNA
jgi:hypothetical protein